MLRIKFHVVLLVVEEGFYCTVCIMGFGDLQTDDGLQALNEYLADKSYIEG